MRRMLPVVFTLAMLCHGAPVQLTLTPTTVAVAPGATVEVEFSISGLDRPPSVGSFDLLLGFDSALVEFTGAEYGLLLGDPSTFEALTSTLLVAADMVSLAEISLLSPSVLDALQPESFVLARATFTAVDAGTAEFRNLGGPVDDGFGDLIAGSKVPEPGTLGMSLIGGLVAAVVHATRRYV